MKEGAVTCHKRFLSQHYFIVRQILLLVVVTDRCVFGQSVSLTPPPSPSPCPRRILLHGT